MMLDSNLRLYVACLPYFYGFLLEADELDNHLKHHHVSTCTYIVHMCYTIILNYTQ